MGNHVVILGAGAIGRWSAYFLAKEGYRVSLVDRGTMKNGCSFGNAGMVVPSHVIPLAAPGMVAAGVRWMMQSKSPFYVRPRLSVELLQWGRSFLKHSTEAHVQHSVAPLRDLSLLSSGLYQQLSGEIGGNDYRSTGLLMAFQSEKVGEKEREASKIAEDAGIGVKYLNAEQVQKLEPNCEIRTVGGVLYPGDGLIDPNRWMEGLHEELVRLGVEMYPETELTSIEKSGNTITRMHLGARTLDVDHVVIATGAWSARVARLFDDRLKLLPGKGYSFVSGDVPRMQQPTILCEGKVAVSPFGDRTRFGGTMEITSVNDRKINKNRVQGILDTVHRFYPEVKVPFPSEIWSGFRPCSSDGLPYLGKGTKFNNVFYATGHGMMGVSMAPGTGKLIAQMVCGEQPEVDVKAFRIDRDIRA